MLTPKQQDALNLKTGRRFYAVAITVTGLLCALFYSWRLLDWVGVCVALFFGIAAGSFVAMLTVWIGDLTRSSGASPCASSSRGRDGDEQPEKTDVSVVTSALAQIRRAADSCRRLDVKPQNGVS